MQTDEKRKSAVMKVSIPILFIAAAIFLFRFSPAKQCLTTEQLGLFLESAGVWAPMMFVFIDAAGMCLFLPGTLLTAVGPPFSDPIGGSCMFGWGL
jgi:uncharacterized membrane protein YdjX (TVP38/TMEM64 family)